MPVYEDPDQVIEIENESVPLAAAPKVTTRTTTSSKTTKTYTKMTKAATKTYSVKLTPTSKTTTTTKKTVTSTTNTTVKTVKTVKTAKTVNYVKGSKTKTIVTVETTTTTVTTTVTTIAAPAVKAPYTVSLTKVAPLADSRLVKAFNTFQFRVVVDGSLAPSGLLDTVHRTIYLKREDDTIYHELGHFLAWLAGDADVSKTFTAAYNAEKGKYNGAGGTYVTQNSKEYYAESYEDYVLRRSGLKAQRPKTYAAIVASLNLITDARIKTYYTFCSAIWK